MQFVKLKKLKSVLINENYGFLSDYRVSEAVTISCNSNLNEYISHLLS
jgi:hypothetical protein